MPANRNYILPAATIIKHQQHRDHPHKKMTNEIIIFGQIPCPKERHARFGTRQKLYIIILTIYVICNV